MGNFLSMLSVDCQIFKPVTWLATISSVFYWLFTLICKVLGLFADLMNIAFYIFSGIDFKENASDASGRYDIKVISTGEKKSILDYFVFSSSMRQAYLYLAIIGLVLIVIFTIYKIIKQDFFDKAGPRSKGPIFRNVAFSCISFLLVIPIFWIIIHASSLLAVAVASAMGMDFNQLAGAKIFCLSWSDNGAFITTVNGYLRGVQTNTKLGWMWNLDDDSLFVTLAKGKYVQYESRLNEIASDGRTFKSYIPDSDDNFAAGIQHDFLLYDGTSLKPGTSVYFYWYIYLVGVVVGIKTLYKLLLAMLQRIFKLMGLFLVAPSPISQYVLDDGQKYKSWLAQSIQEGLRLVVATMSFAIFLLVLEAVTNIDFISAFNTAVNDASSESNTINVSAKLLSYSGEVERVPMLAGAEGDNEVMGNLANAFLKIFVLMGAGGAVTDLDPVLTPLISGGKSSLDAGATGSAASAPVNVAKSAAGALVGSIAGGIKSGLTNAVGKARASGKEEGAADANKEEHGVTQDNSPKPTNGGTGGPGGTGVPGGSGGDTKDGASAPSQGAPTDENKNGDNNGVNENAPGDENKEPKDDAGEEVETPENENGGDTKDGAANPEGEENKGEEKGEDANTDDEENKETSEKPSTANATATDENKADKPDFNKRKTSGLLRKIAVGTGKVVWKGAKRTGVALGQTGLSVGRGTLGGLRGAWKGVGKALSTAAKMIAVGALGKETVEAFTGAKADYIKKETDKDTGRAKKAHDKAYEKSYTKEKQKQLKEAAEVVKEKGNKVEGDSEALSAATSAEQVASQNVADAEAAQAVEGVKAAQAGQAAIDGDSAIAGNNKEIEKFEGKKAAATSQAEAIKEKYGLHTAEDVEKFKKKCKEDIALNGGSLTTTETRDYQALVKAEDSIKQSDAQIAMLKDRNESRAKTVNAMSGRNGDLTKAGVTADMSFEEARKRVNDSKDVSQETKDAFNANGAEKIYNSDAVVASRQAQDNLQIANEGVASARSAYAEAHKTTEQRRAALNSSMTQYGNAIKVASIIRDDANTKARTQFARSTTADGLGQRIFRGARKQKRNEIFNGMKTKTTLANASRANGIQVEPPEKLTVASMNSYLDAQTGAANDQFNNDMAGYNEYMQQHGDDQLEFRSTQTVKKTVTETIPGTSKVVKGNYGRVMEGVIEGNNINLQRLNENINTSVPEGEREEVRAAIQEFARGGSATRNFDDNLGRRYANLARKHKDIVGKSGDSSFESNLGMPFKGLEGDSTKGKTTKSAVEGLWDFKRMEESGIGKMMTGTHGAGGETYDQAKAQYITGFDDFMKNKFGDKTIETDPVERTREVEVQEEKVEKMSVKDFMARHQAHDGNSYNSARIVKDLEGAGGSPTTKAGLATAAYSYNAAQETYNSRMAQINTARGVINSIGERGNGLARQASANLDRYVDSVAQVATLDSVINSGGQGPISKQTRMLIGSTIGAKNGTITTTDPEKIVQYAKQAKEVKCAEQEQLIKSSEGLAREGSKNSEDLKTTMASMIDMLSGKLKDNSGNGGQGAQNVTNINNYTQGNTTANEWFNNSNTLNNTNNQSIPAASGLAQSTDRTAMYERMQVEGIKHMEDIVSRLQQEYRETSKKIDDIKRTVDDLADK